MAEQEVRIRITAEGVDDTRRKLDTVSDAVDNVTESAQGTSTGFTEMARTGQSVVQRMQGVASAVQTLTSAMGSENRTAGLIASIAGTSAQFAAMGAMLGPAGAVGGAIAGMVVSINQLASASDAAASAASRHSEAMQRVAQINRDVHLSRLENAVRTGEGLDEFSEDELRAARINRGEDRARLSRDPTLVERFTDMLAGVDADGRAEGAARLGREIDHIDENLRERIERMRTNMTREASASRATIRTMEDRLAGGGRRGGGGSGGPSPAEEAIARELASREEVAERARRLQEELDEEEEKRLDDSLARQAAHEEERIALMNERLDAAREFAEEELDIEVQALERSERQRNAAARAEREESETRAQAAQAEREEIAAMLGEMASNTIQLLSQAVAKIIEGEMSAEQAFAAMGQAFLEMLSEFATLQAAKEFALAAGSFASMDYGGGAAHIGAGLAFTALAVATGVAGAAIGGPPNTPARPEAGNTIVEGGGGGNVVINWNSPVVTAGTRAELGREILTMTSEAGSI